MAGSRAKSLEGERGWQQSCEGAWQQRPNRSIRKRPRVLGEGRGPSSDLTDVGARVRNEVEMSGLWWFGWHEMPEMSGSRVTFCFDPVCAEAPPSGPRVFPPSHIWPYLGYSRRLLSLLPRLF
jgi:hypothetical protein